jgi:outer membrane protein assembly factor BamE
MRKLLVIMSLWITLSGCSYLHVHRMDIEQGNYITPEMVSKIHPGMTQSQVKEIVGDPILANVFDKNRIDYVYTFKPGNGEMTEKYITLIFRNGHLSTISGNMYSQYIKGTHN